MSAYKIEAWTLSDPDGPPHVTFQAATFDELSSFFRALESRPRWSKMAITDLLRNPNPERHIAVQTWADVQGVAATWADSEQASRSKRLILLPKEARRPARAGR